MPKKKKMDIACLGWGSLIWDPRALPIRGKWFDDGPLLPIEFARESRDQRITLVIAEVDYTVRSLWALMSVATLEEAKRALADREGITEQHIKNSIGFWEKQTGDSNGESAIYISSWAENKQLGAVVWTNLKFGFKDTRDQMPKYEDILKHLKGLPREKQMAAEEYVRRTSVQIDTEFRRCLSKDLGWSPIA